MFESFEGFSAIKLRSPFFLDVERWRHIPRERNPSQKLVTPSKLPADSRWTRA